jgi:hypothetical protein
VNASLIVALVLGGSAPATGPHAITGVVRNQATKVLIQNALVVLQCTCIEGTRETKTNAAGVYRFTGLPNGTYTLQVLVGKADVSKVVTLGSRSD